MFHYNKLNDDILNWDGVNSLTGNRDIDRFEENNKLVSVKSAVGLGWNSSMFQCSECLRPLLAQRQLQGLDPISLRYEENRAALLVCSLSIHSGTGASPRSWARCTPRWTSTSLGWPGFIALKLGLAETNSRLCVLLQLVLEVIGYQSYFLDWLGFTLQVLL